MRFLAGLTVLLVAISTPAHGTLRFVGHAGSDVGDCAVASLPCETIQYAVDQSFSGDVVRVQEGGLYRENLEISTAIGNLTIEGGWTDSFGWQHLDPTATIIDGDEDGQVVLVQTGAGSTHLRLENLTLRNGSSSSPYGGGVAVNTLSGMTAKVTLDHVVLRDNHAGTGGGAAVRAWGGTAELVIQHSMVVDNIAGEGGGLAVVADLGGTAKLRLESSTVRDNQAQEWPDSWGFGGAVYATSIREGAADVDIVNSVLAHNPSHRGAVYGRSGDCAGCHIPATTDIIMINATVTDNSTTGVVVRSWDQGKTDLTIWNTVAWGNSYYDIDAMGDAVTTEVDVWYSDVQRTTIGFNATYTVHGTDYDADPLFVDPGRSDYHLTDASPMIDAGICGLLVPNPLGGPPIYVRIAPLLDVDDDLRPAPEELWDCDVGADEYLPFERWVSPGGTDADNSCDDSVSPCATVQHALDQAIADGGHYKTVVYLATGTYSEAVSISDSPAPVTLWGGWSADFSSCESSAFTTIIDANGLGGALDYEVAGGMADLRLENLTLTDGFASLGGGLSFRCTLSHGLLHIERVALHANHVTDSGGGMRIRPIACDLRVRVVDTIVTDNSAVNGGGGIWFRIDDGSSLHASLYASTVAGNDASYGGGVIFQQTGTGKGWLFPNSSLLTLNRGVADGPDDLWIEQSGSNFVLVNASHSSIQSVTQYGGLYDPDGTVISVNPGFRDPASGDYHLTPYSQVRGLGNCGLGSTLDCDGDDRPASGCDMGADQFNGIWVPPLDLWIAYERLSGGMVREACRSISAGPEVVVQPGVVELRAGDILVFNNGFEVTTNASFKARLYRHPACP